MGSLRDLAGRVEEVATAGGKFADAFVRTAGATVAGALVFAERELGYARRALKRRKSEGDQGREGSSSD
jgi:orotate phosphoribosyltransferase